MLRWSPGGWEQTPIWALRPAMSLRSIRDKTRSWDWWRGSSTCSSRSFARKLTTNSTRFEMTFYMKYPRPAQHLIQSVITQLTHIPSRVSGRWRSTKCSCRPCGCLAPIGRKLPRESKQNRNCKRESMLYSLCLDCLLKIQKKRKTTQLLTPFPLPIKITNSENRTDRKARTADWTNILRSTSWMPNDILFIITLARKLTQKISRKNYWPTCKTRILEQHDGTNQKSLYHASRLGPFNIKTHSPVRRSQNPSKETIWTLVQSLTRHI